MEACGIDVFATVRANGLEIHTLREKGRSTKLLWVITCRSKVMLQIPICRAN